jgi:hypothetical protein
MQARRTLGRDEAGGQTVPAQHRRARLGRAERPAAARPARTARRRPEGVVQTTVDGRARTLVLCDTSRYLLMD